MKSILKYHLGIVADTENEFLLYKEVFKNFSLLPTWLNSNPKKNLTHKEKNKFFILLNTSLFSASDNISPLTFSKDGNLSFQLNYVEKDIIQLIKDKAQFKKIIFLLPKSTKNFDLAHCSFPKNWEITILCSESQHKLDCSHLKTYLEKSKDYAVFAPYSWQKEIEELGFEFCPIIPDQSLLQNYAVCILQAFICFQNESILNLIAQALDQVNHPMFILENQSTILHTNKLAKKLMQNNFDIEKYLKQEHDKNDDSILPFSYSLFEARDAYSNSNYKILHVFPKLHSIENSKDNSSEIRHEAFANIITQSPKVKKAIHIAEKFAMYDEPVFLYGESGVGKELFARGIHYSSQRANHPFVAINCAAIPKELFESELFGYVQGAFTSASKDGKIGFFEQVGEGTLLLDEITEIPLHLQASLLRVIQEKEFVKIGETKTIPMNCRIITTSNIPLDQMIKQKIIREDLFHRLNVLGLHIPPLRDRDNDLPYLVEYKLNQHAKKYNKQILTLSPKALTVLESHAWPGNIRELMGVIERTAILSDGPQVTASEILSSIENYQLMYSCESNQQNHLSINEISMENKHSLLDQTILETVNSCQGNLAKASKILGIHRTTLWRKLNKIRTEN